MCEILCLAGFWLAQLWTASSALDDGVAHRGRIFTLETRTAYGPPILGKIPYVNRLFRVVGYSREEWSLGTAIVGAAAAHEEWPPSNTHQGNLSGAAIGTGLGAHVGSNQDRRTQETLTPELNLPIRNSSFNFVTPQFGGYQPDAEGWGATVGGICGTPHKAEHRVLACWDARVHVCADIAHPGTKRSSLKGSVYLFATESGKTVDANGYFVVELCDTQARKLAEWTFDADSLESLKRKDLIGVGYSLCLPLDARSIAAQDVKLKLTYHTWRGKACSAEATRLTLQTERTALVQAQHSAPRQFTPTFHAREAKRMTLTQIIELCRRDVAEDIIIRHMEATDSVFELTVDDILYLRDQGVSNAVIRAMQLHGPRMKMIDMEKAPRPVQRGNGPGSSSL